MIQVYEFIEDVKSGKLVSNKYIKLAVKRFEDDLKRKDLHFDTDSAQAALDILGLLKHTKGAYKGQPFGIQSWQAFFIANLYGWKKNGKRRFRKVYAQIARKNGKSELAGGIGLIEMFFSPEADKTPEVYSAATKRDQAKIVFEAACSMAKQLAEDSPAFKKLADIFKHHIEKKDGGIFRALASDSNSLDGLSPSCAIIDEMHAHKDSSLLKVLETGQGSRSNPLLLIITTSGFSIGGACHKYYQVVCNILENKIQDDATFGMIFQLDEEDIDGAVDNPDVWIKANPCIGRTPNWEYMKSMALSAKNEGATAMTEFLCKNLNQWVSSQSVWINDEDWMCEEMSAKVEEDLKGEICYAGLDLASVQDTTALVLYFPKYNLVKPFFWLPEDRVGIRAVDGVPYLDWLKEDTGLMTTPGNATDYNFIKKKIIQFNEVYDLKLVYYDRYNSSQAVIDLLEEGVPMEPMSQGYLAFNRPMKEIEKMVADKVLVHEGNPMMRWQMGNVVLKTDEYGNIKPNKGASSEKIDGVVAMAMAIGACLQDNYKNIGSKSIYEDRGFRDI